MSQHKTLKVTKCDATKLLLRASVSCMVAIMQYRLCCVVLLAVTQAVAKGAT